ncbi:MAG: hypothetical protein IJ730_02270 [Alphaproteobacteria bacterium]|nr:hypothetical protein [Alphaproteobacteria bacterium]
MKILGHNKIEKELAHAIISEKIFPTWIFSGPFGVGKYSMAIKFAKCLLSGIKPESDFSLDIPENNKVHKLIDSRIHPDFFILEQSEDNISINDTRELMQRIYKMPTMSKWRVIIIENASRLNKNIYNSFLKILEEPPENTVIIMICQSTGNIPKTLLSRANRVFFSALTNEQVESVLIDMKIKNAQELSKISNGSIGYALYLNDHKGIDIFNKLLDAFSTYNKKSLQYILENNLNGNFRIIKESLLTILKMYIEQITQVSNNQIFKKTVTCSIESELKKIMEIISMLNKSESLMLDKQVVLAYSFEKFFDF